MLYAVAPVSVAILHGKLMVPKLPEATPARVYVEGNVTEIVGDVAAPPGHQQGRGDEAARADLLPGHRDAGQADRGHDAAASPQASDKRKDCERMQDRVAMPPKRHWERQQASHQDVGLDRGRVLKDWHRAEDRDAGESGRDG